MGGVGGEAGKREGKGTGVGTGGRKGKKGSVFRGMAGIESRQRAMGYIIPSITGILNGPA